MDDVLGREQRDRRMAEALPRERELLQRIFDTVPLMMTIYEPDTQVLRVNRAFEQLIGWTSEELASISLMEQCYPDPGYREDAAAFMQACLPEWRDFRVRTRSGGEVESSWTNVRLSDRTQLGIGIDITERKRAERALRASEEALRHAGRLKDEFLATLAHELRNPLSPMRSAVDLLRMADGASQGSKALAVLDRQIGVMVRLVDDLLDVSRITSGKIDLRKERLDLTAIARSALEANRTFFREKGVELTIAAPVEPVPVDGDSVRLEQVLSNLLNNAAKFTPPGGKVLLAVEHQGDEAVVRVRDSGIGIAPDILPDIFGMFVQGDLEAARYHGGLGIGLSLVKRLAELHGGSAAASSAGLGQGSEFVVRLPLVAGAVPKAFSPVDAHQAALKAPGIEVDRQEILVVDDNADAADTLAQLLAAYGHRVLTAGSATAGIELAKAHGVRAIVMDLGMPGVSGYEAARMIRADPQLRDILLIALSGWGQDQARRDSRDAGFDHHLVKPADLGALEKVLRSTPR